MTYFFGGGSAELQILKKWKWPYFLNWVEYCDDILHWYWHDSQMTFGIGRGFAEFQILKTVKFNS